MDRKELPNKLANLSRKIAFRDKVSTNSILRPMLKRQGFENETWSIIVGFDEDLDKVPSKQIMEDFGLLDWLKEKKMKENLFNINEIQITDIRYDLPDGRYGNIRFNDLLCILNKEERAKIMRMARTLINDEVYLDVIKEK